MRKKIVRLTRNIEGQTESRIYVEEKDGYTPLWFATGQKEEFQFTEKEIIGEITILEGIRKQKTN